MLSATGIAGRSAMKSNLISRINGGIAPLPAPSAYVDRAVAGTRKHRG
jgi:hypothetical protein